MIKASRRCLRRLPPVCRCFADFHGQSTTVPASSRTMSDRPVHSSSHADEPVSSTVNTSGFRTSSMSVAASSSARAVTLCALRAASRTPRAPCAIVGACACCLGSCAYGTSTQHSGYSAHSSSRNDYYPSESSPIDSAPEPPRRRVTTAPVHLARRVVLPHLAVPPLAIHRWHVRMDSTPPSPMVPTRAVIAALTAEHQTAKLFASTTPASPAPTVIDILREAGRRARSRGTAQVTPLDVRHAAQLFAPPRASLVPPKPFVDPHPEHADELPGLFDTVRAAVEASGHRPPRGLSVGDATGIVANAFRKKSPQTSADGSACETARVHLAPCACAAGRRQSRSLVGA